MLTPRTFGIGLLCWLLTGIYMVRVDEQAVVRRFGGVVGEHVPPGLHFGLPWGIDRVDRVKVREQKRLNVGFEFPDMALGRPGLAGRSEFFTGDQNLVTIELLVQYTVREPRAYLFAAVNAEDTLRQAAEAAITTAVATRAVDVLLTTGKLAVQDELQREVQRFTDHYGLGITVTGVNIQAVTPPLKVADAFRDVASAREDRDRIIQEAHSYANAAIPAAQGAGAKMHEEAIADRDQKALQARGDAERFIQAFAAYRKSPDVSSSRLYLEAIEQIMPRLKIISVDRTGGRNPVDLNLLPRAPSSVTAAAPTPAPDNSSSTAPPTQTINRPAPGSTGGDNASTLVPPANIAAGAPGKP